MSLYQMYTNVHKCTKIGKMLWFSTKCSQMYTNVQKLVRCYDSLYKCTQMYTNVQKLVRCYDSLSNVHMR